MDVASYPNTHYKTPPGKSVGNTLRFGRLMPSSILNEAFVAGESAAQRLEGLAGLKLQPRVLAEVTQAKHDIGNLLQ